MARQAPEMQKKLAEFVKKECGDCKGDTSGEWCEDCYKLYLIDKPHIE